MTEEQLAKLIKDQLKDIPHGCAFSVDKNCVHIYVYDENTRHEQNFTVHVECVHDSKKEGQ